MPHPKAGQFAQQHQSAIYRQCSTLAGAVDAGFQIGLPVGVACGYGGQLDRLCIPDAHDLFPHGTLPESVTYFAVKRLV